MNRDLLTLLAGKILEEDVELSLVELSQACHLSAEQILELVEQGLLDPQGENPSNWRFQGISIHKVQIALRLKRDLGVNLAGAALALELLDELEILRARLKRFES